MSKPKRYRAMANYRDFDGVTRVVEASGRTATQASQNLRMRLQSRTRAGGYGEFTGISRFSDVAVLWTARMNEMVVDGGRSPGTIETYERQRRNHVLPAMGEVRLGEVTTPLVDKVIASIKRKVSRTPPGAAAVSSRECWAWPSGTARSPTTRCARWNESSLAPSGSPRALTVRERLDLLRQLQADEKAQRRDLPDLVFFILATGVRIGEALAVVWSQVDWETGTVEISSTLVRVRCEGLLRKGTKSRAGERVLTLPPSAVSMLRSRFMSGARLDQPLFPDVLGGFRDPANVRREPGKPG